MISKEQGIIVFLGLPVLFFAAFLILVVSAHKREGRRFSFLKEPLFNSFSEINPVFLYVTRILFILYVVTSIPFYAYLTYFASQYSGMYLSLVLVTLSMVVTNGVTTFLASFVKLSLPKGHIFSFLGMAITSIATSLLMAQFFNVTREMHVFALELDNILFAITIISIIPTIIEAIIIANKRLLKWEFYDKEKDKVYYLALAEWSTVFVSLLSLIISILGFFLIQ